MKNNSQQDEKNPFADMGFIRFWVVSTIFWMTVSCLIMSLLPHDGSFQNQAICEGTHKRFSSDNLDYPSRCLRPYLCHLPLRLWVVLKRLILLEDVCWIEMSVSEQLPHVLVSRDECHLWYRHTHLKEPRHCFMS